MAELSNKELERRVLALGETLLEPPSSEDELISLLDQAEKLVSKVEQSPPKSMLTALSPLMKALVSEKVLRHSDVDVQVGVASCLNEIIRISAPDAPYDDEQMKDVCQLIVSSFNDISDISSKSHEKRVSILETVSKVRSSVIMLDLECDQMIIEMFQLFLNAIRDYHKEVIFASMEGIMTVVFEESEDISVDLLNPILATLNTKNETVLPIARKLAKRVVQSCAEKLRPYLSDAVKTLGTPLDDYDEVITSICRDNAETDRNDNDENIGDQQVVKDSTEETNSPDKDLAENGLPLSIGTNGVNVSGNGETMTDSNYSKNADLDNKNARSENKDVNADDKGTDADDKNAVLDAKSTSKRESGDLGAKKSSESETKAKHLTAREFKSDSAESSDPLCNEEEAQQVLSDREIAGGDGHSSSPSEAPPVEAATSSDKVKDTSIQISPVEESEDEDVNVAAPVQSRKLGQHIRPTKSAQKKGKNKSGKKGTGSIDTTSKKVSDGENVSESKKQRTSLKKSPAETNKKDNVLTNEAASKNDGDSTTDSETIPLQVTKKQRSSRKKPVAETSNKDNILSNEAASKHDDESTSDSETIPLKLTGKLSKKMPHGSTSRKDNGEKSIRGKSRSKKDVIESSAKEDEKDTVTSPRSPLKSKKDGSNSAKTSRTSAKRKRTPGTEKASETLEYGENLVGSKVRVWWPKDQMFYEGVVASFDSVKNKHKVLYNDGDEENLVLRKEKWEFIEDDLVSDRDKAVDNSSDDTASDMQGAKKGATGSSKRVKIENSPKSKSKDTATKSGGKVKDNGKTESKIVANSSKSSGKSEDERPQKPGAKTHDESKKASTGAKDVDAAMTSSRSASKSKGKASQSGKAPNASGTGVTKSSSFKVKETDGAKEKSIDLAKSPETAKGKSPGTVKSGGESGTKSGKKRRR